MPSRFSWTRRAQSCQSLGPWPDSRLGPPSYPQGVKFLKSGLVLKSYVNFVFYFIIIIVNVEVFSMISPRCQADAPGCVSCLSCGFVRPPECIPQCKRPSWGEPACQSSRIYLSRLLLWLRAVWPLQTTGWHPSTLGEAAVPDFQHVGVSCKAAVLFDSWA